MTKRMVCGVAALALGMIPAVTSAAPGDPDPDFGTDGVVTVELLDRVGAITVDATGRIVVAGVEGDGATGTAAITRYLPDGAPDTSFSGDGRADLGVTVAQFVAVDVRVLDDGSVVTGGYRTTDPSDPFSNGLWAAKVDTDGEPVAAYGTGGVSTLDQGFTVFSPFGSIGPDGSMTIRQGGIGAFGSSFQTRVDPSGSFSDVVEVGGGLFDEFSGCIILAAFNEGAARLGTNGSVRVSRGILGGDAGCGNVDDEVLIVVAQTDAGAELWTTTLLTAAPGGSLGPVEIIGDDVFVGETSRDDMGNVTTSYVHRLNVGTGGPVEGWGTNGRAELGAGFGPVDGVAGLPGGQIVVISGPDAFVPTPPTLVNVERLDADGSPDESFGDASARRTIAAGAVVDDSAVAADSGGGIVVAVGTADEVTLRRFGGEPDLGTFDPARLWDSRANGETVDGISEKTGKLGAGEFEEIQITGRAGVPDGATAAAVNLAAIRPDSPGFATLYPCTAEPPLAASLNFEAGQSISNATTVKLSDSGALCVFTSAPADYALDIVGYVPAGSDVGAVDPARLWDSRAAGETVDGESEKTGKLGAGEFEQIQITGRAGVPDGVSAATVNLAAIRPDSGGFATLYPCTAEPPLAASLNFAAGQNISNTTTVKLSDGGALCVFTSAPADYALDIVGYVPAGSDVGAVDPSRLWDSRAGGETVDGISEKTGKLGAGEFEQIQITGRAGVPDGASAATVNLAAIRPDSPGFATLYPCTAEPPLAASLNFEAGQNISNATTVALSDSGALCVFTSASADYALDLVGFVN